MIVSFFSFSSRGVQFRAKYNFKLISSHCWRIRIATHDVQRTLSEAINLEWEREKKVAVAELFLSYLAFINSHCTFVFIDNSSSFSFLNTYTKSWIQLNKKKHYMWTNLLGWNILFFCGAPFVFILKLVLLSMCVFNWVITDLLNQSLVTFT